LCKQRYHSADLIVLLFGEFSGSATLPQPQSCLQETVLRIGRETYPFRISDACARGIEQALWAQAKRASGICNSVVLLGT